MPFSIEGSVSGGTFNAVTGDLNQVSGNLTQVFNSQVHSSATPALDGPGGALALSSPDNQSVIGALRHQRRALRAQSAPYSKELRTIGDRSEASDAVASETSPNLQASSSTSSAAIPYEHIPGYHGNVSVDLIPLSEHHGVHDSGEEFSPHTFNNVAGNMTQLRVTSYGESGIDILYRHISMGAVYNSGEQLPDPACHPGTRVAVLEQLSGWSSDDRTETTILWLRGSAGMGKSAIAQMFAGGCSRLGASFFFRRGSPERRSWHRLFTTLAYQLARSVPGLAVPIQHAVETDKLVVNQPMTLQFQRLIVEPLKQVPVGGVVPVLVLDGLDECEDEEIQQDILRLFINAIHEQKLRVRLLLSSRPEPHIKEVLENQATLGICRNLELFPDESAYADIRRYLQDEFSKIRVEFVAREIDLGEVWPTPDVVDHLVKKSCGIFIYAATVISFVGDQYRHPQEELESVLNLDPKSTAPLDDLYTQILSTLNRPTRSDRKNVVASATNRQLRILHILWQMSLRPFPLHVDPEEVDELLNLSSGTSRLILRRLHSLLIVPSRRSRVGLRPQVEFLHASFPDYLGDSQRSKEWCVSTGWLHSDYLFGMIRVLSSPPVTDSAMAFHREVALALPRVLSGATPCHEVFAVLRNEVFQRSLFLVGEQPASECIPWPQRGSLYPMDLIELWEDHRFISVFTTHLKQSRTESPPTFKFDPLYREILASHPALIYILTACLLMPGDLFSILRIHGLTYGVFKPFLSLRPQLELPFPEGDSPLDFVADPDRILELGSDQGLTGNILVLRWIRRAKEFLTDGDFWLHPNALEVIANCEPSSELVAELATLDLSKICEQMNSNREVHETLHMEVTSDHHLRGVVRWLQALPEPPLEIIEFWERQIADIQGCISDLESTMGP